MTIAPCCPDCGHKPPTVKRKYSRVYVDYECSSCGLSWRADAVTHRLITRLITSQTVDQ